MIWIFFICLGLWALSRLERALRRPSVSITINVTGDHIHAYCNDDYVGSVIDGEYRRLR